MAVSVVYTILLLVTFPALNLGLLSDYKICGDAECESPMSRVQAIRDYHGQDCRFLSFRQGDTIFVYHKLTGKREDLWAGTIDKQFGYFSKDAVKVEDVHTATEKVVATQDSDFFCVDEYGYIIDSHHLDGDDGGDGKNPNQKVEPAPHAYGSNVEGPPVSEATESPTPGDEAENIVTEEIQIAADQDTETKEGLQEAPAAPNVQGGSPSGSWLGSSVTGWFGLNTVEEPSNLDEVEKKDEDKETTDGASLTSSVTGWLGWKDGKEADKSVKSQEQDLNTADSFTSRMTGWIDSEAKTDQSAEKEQSEGGEDDIEVQEPAEKYRSRRMSLELESSLLEEEEKGEIGMLEWLGTGLTNQLNFGQAVQETTLTPASENTGGEKEEEEQEASWFQVGIGNILGYKTEADLETESDFKEKNIGESQLEETLKDQNVPLDTEILEQVVNNSNNSKESAGTSKSSNERTSTEGEPNTGEDLNHPSPVEEQTPSSSGSSSLFTSLYTAEGEDKEGHSVLDNDRMEINSQEDVRSAELQAREASVKHENENSKTIKRDEKKDTKPQAGEIDQLSLAQSDVGLPSDLNYVDLNLKSTEQSTDKGDKTEKLVKIHHQIDDISHEAHSGKEENFLQVNISTASQQADESAEEGQDSDPTQEGTEGISEEQNTLAGQDGETRVEGEETRVDHLGFVTVNDTEANQEESVDGVKMLHVEDSTQAFETSNLMPGNNKIVSEDVLELDRGGTRPEDNAGQDSGLPVLENIDGDTNILEKLDKLLPAQTETEEQETGGHRSTLGSTNETEDQEEHKETEEAHSLQKPQVMDEDEQEEIDVNLREEGTLKELKGAVAEKQQEHLEVTTAAAEVINLAQGQEKEREVVEMHTEKKGETDEIEEEEEEEKVSIKADEEQETVEEVTEKKQEEKEVVNEMLQKIDGLKEKNDRKKLEEIQEGGDKGLFREEKEVQEPLKEFKNDKDNDERQLHTENLKGGNHEGLNGEERIEGSSDQEETSVLGSETEGMEAVVVSKEKYIQKEVTEAPNVVKVKEFEELKEEENQQESEVGAEKPGKPGDEQTNDIADDVEKITSQWSLAGAGNDASSNGNSTPEPDADIRDSAVNRDVTGSSGEGNTLPDSNTFEQEDSIPTDDSVSFTREKTEQIHSDGAIKKAEDSVEQNSDTDFNNMPGSDVATGSSYAFAKTQVVTDNHAAAQDPPASSVLFDGHGEDRARAGKAFSLFNSAFSFFRETESASRLSGLGKSQGSEAEPSQTLDQEAESSAESPGVTSQGLPAEPDIHQPVTPSLSHSTPEIKQPVTHSMSHSTPEIKQPVTPSVSPTESEIPQPATPFVSHSTPEINQPATPSVPPTTPEVHQPATPSMSPAEPQIQQPATPSVSPTEPEVPLPATTSVSPTEPEVPLPATPSVSPTEPELPRPATPSVSPTEPEVPLPATPSVSPTEHEVPLPATPSVSQSQPSSASASTGNPLQSKTFSKDYGSLLAHVNEADVALLVELFGRHKLQFLDYILGVSEPAAEERDHDESILTDIETLLNYHMETLVAQRRLAGSVQEDEQKAGSLIALQKLQELLARVRKSFDRGNTDESDTNHQDKAELGCVGQSCLSESKDEGIPTDEESSPVRRSTAHLDGRVLIGIVRQIRDVFHHINHELIPHIHAVGELLVWLSVQVVSALPDDIRPGPDLYGVPWEPIIISGLVGLMSVLLFMCRCYSSIKSRLYRNKEKWMANLVAQQLDEKCEVLETLSKCQQEHDELESSLRDSGLLVQTQKTDHLEGKVEQLGQAKKELQKDLGQLKDQLDQQRQYREEQERRIAELEESMKTLEEEGRNLQSQDEQAQTTLKVYSMNSDRLNRNLETAGEENKLLQESNVQLRQQVEGWAERVCELEAEMSRCQVAHSIMLQDVANKDERIMSLTDRLLGMKAWDSDVEEEEAEKEKETTNGAAERIEVAGKGDGECSQRHLQKVQKLIYAAKLNADLKSVDEDKDRTFAKLNDEIKAKEDLEVGIKELEKEKLSLQSDSESYADQVQRLQQKLHIMTEMYQENELKLHRMLTVEEKERVQKEEKLNKADKSIALAMEELNNYRQRAAEMEEELEKTNQSYQTQISTHEKKAHNNWLAARAAERDLSDIRRENALLRQKLTETQLKLDSLDKDPYTLDSLARPLPFRGERSPYGPSPLGRPASETRAFLSPPTLLDGPPNRLSPRVPRIPLEPPGGHGEMERVVGTHSDSGSGSPTWERDRRGPPPLGPPGPLPPPGYMFPEPGGPMYRRPPLPPGPHGFIPPPGSLHPRSFPPGPPHHLDMADGSFRENSFAPGDQEHGEPLPEAGPRMVGLPPLGPRPGPMDGSFSRRAPYGPPPPEFYPPRGPGGPPMRPMWPVPPPGAMFPPRFPPSGPPLPPHMLPPPPDSLPPHSMGPPPPQQTLPSPPHGQPQEEHTPSPEDTI